MLATLSIRDVVLVDRLDIDLAPGLCVLTGETGAGKSILLDALGLCLGARADSGLIRHGRDQAMVSAAFDLPAEHPALAVLAAHGFTNAADGLVLRRVLASDGRSRAFINDQPVSVALLRGVGEALVEIHGQFESQRLLDPATHRDLLDAFGGLEVVVSECRRAWSDWRQAVAQRATAAAEMEAARRDEDFLRHALGELIEIDPRAGEEEELAGQRQLLMNAEKLLTAINDALDELTGGAGRGVTDSLHAALRQVQRVAEKAEGRLDPAAQALDRALTEAIEAQAQLAQAARAADLDPRRLEQVEERLFKLRAVARKHTVTVDGLVPLREDFAARLAAVDDGVAALDALDRRERAAARHYRETAAHLSERRQAAAACLDQAVAAELAPLRLGKARFVTRVEPLQEKEWGAHGVDRVLFEVATNPGTPPGPLARIASGGELSRFMLALKVVLARADPVPTLIFDEVDAGIGGAVAAAVGDRLASLGADVQVLVVTHSPQVAARGTRHWRILKSVDEGTARTLVQPLDDAGRREEIARMLAGERVTDEARAAALSLLARTPA